VTATRRRVAVIEGDGIGPEVVAAAQDVADAAGADVEWVPVIAGQRAYVECGVALPPDALETIRQCGVALKGPLVNPTDGYTSPNIALRVELGVYANVRLARTLEGVPTRYPGTDLAVIREVTEDLFTGVQQMVGPDSAIAVKYVTRAATTRVAEFAFDWARRNGRRKITVVHKATVLRSTDGLFLEAAQHVAARNPDIECDEMLIDTVAMQLVKDPGRFDTLLTGFFYGDILADLVAGIAGGLGLAPGASFGDNVALFEPVHGTAPRHAGSDSADPVAMILTVALLVAWLGDPKCATRIRRAVEQVLAGRTTVTRDLGGTASTKQMTDAIAAAAARI
jgi:isocitrate dehydrogenase (NAD+)